ncbi:membrane protein FAM174B [Protopterus annectens]|uniref:membrane protein FAM174B n=1 Tax=Protopterus annectens TaxID=7888 RepID=UPI001CFAE7ED|nr:membrane protein FAM174B [Protopterus annectens]XP_043934318.1 membrane protein FAM174B [Protopterus annectens]
MQIVYFAFAGALIVNGAFGILTNQPDASSNATEVEDQGMYNSSTATPHFTTGTKLSRIIQNLSMIKNIVFCVLGITAFLITCLVVKVVRSGRRIRKTRKYDIITTPAERVEMAPLNEDNDDDEDATVFDVKYK